MNRDLKKIKFNMTSEMADELNNFFNLKFKLEMMKRKSLENNNMLSFDEKEVVEQIEKCRNTFIKEFRKNNQTEIKEYLNITTDN